MIGAPVTLDDLDREELLELVRGPGAPPWTERNIVHAQWQTASARCAKYDERALAMSDGPDGLIALAKAVEKAADEMRAAIPVSSRAWLRWSDRYEKARDAYMAASAKQTRLFAIGDKYRRLAERLYARMRELP